MESSNQPKFVFLLIIPIVIALGIVFTFPKASDTSKKQTIRQNTLDAFQNNLKADMTFEQIKDVFGEPDQDIGSGIHIYVYPLSDGSRVLIGYSDKIMYANVENSQGVQTRLITPLTTPSTTDTTQTSETPPQVTIANPASKYCTDNGGTLSIKKDTYGGEVGYCTLTTGEVCDEWAFYRKECGVKK